MSFTTKELILISMFAALTAIFSQIIIPLPFTPIPINLATVSVFTAGCLLRPASAAAAFCVYVLLGAIGLPVFSGFRGGLGVIAGPTGGYIIGYIIAVIAIAYLNKIFLKNVHKMQNMQEILASAAFMCAGAFCYYVLGTAWFMFVTKNALSASLVMCVYPFLPGDALKIALSAVLVKRVKAS